MILLSVGNRPFGEHGRLRLFITAGSEMDQAIMTEYDLKKMKVGHK